MTTKEIEQKLYHYVDCRRNIMVPRITGLYPMIRFETDMVSVSKSGFITGYEIKISRSDFMKDFKKPHLQQVIKSGRPGLESYYGGLKYFYYVMPVDLVEKFSHLIPEHFGIMAVTEGWISTRRKAPVLFNQKHSPDQVLKIARLGCIRLINL